MAKRSSDSQSNSPQETKDNRSDLDIAIGAAQAAYDQEYEAYRHFDTKISIVLSALLVFTTLCFGSLDYANLLSVFANDMPLAKLIFWFVGVSICFLGIVMIGLSTVCLIRALMTATIQIIKPKDIQYNLETQPKLTDCLFNQYQIAWQSLFDLNQKKAKLFNSGTKWGFIASLFILVGFIVLQIVIH